MPRGAFRETVRSRRKKFFAWKQKDGSLKTTISLTWSRNHKSCSTSAESRYFIEPRNTHEVTRVHRSRGAASFLRSGTAKNLYVVTHGVSNVREETKETISFTIKLTSTSSNETD